MDFEQAYREFIEFHVGSGNGNSSERIKSGLNHAEKLFLENVWWPAFGNFDLLHPEYEVLDYKDGHRYIDFAYIQRNFQIAIEIDGIGPHWKDISADQFCDHNMRQNHLTIDGWRILRFAYKDVKERPRLCQQICQQLLGRLTGDVSKALHGMPILDREILRLAMTLPRPITPKDVTNTFSLERHAAARRLKGLAQVDWLEPVKDSHRVRSYRVHPTRLNVKV